MKLREKLAERRENKELKARIEGLEKSIYLLKDRIEDIERCINRMERIIPNARRETYEAIEQYLKENVSIVFHRMEEGLMRAELKQRMFDNIFGEEK